MGPKVRRFKVLTQQEGQVVIDFRKLTQLYRCFQRHGCPKLEKSQAKEKVAKKQFKAYPTRYFI